MSLKGKFKSDSKLREDGVWFDVTTNRDKSNCRVKLRRSGRGNRHWVTAYRDRTANVDMDNLTVEEDERITADVFASSCVVGWEHMQPEDDGENVEFTPEAALALLSDPDWVDLLKDWQAKANSLSPFQKKREGEAKN